jgi:hypothetical protein
MVVTTLSTGYLGMGWSAVVLIMVVLVLFLSFVSIHYIRRGMERIAVVEGLRDAVSRGRNEDDEVEVSGEAYDLIANMERDQIIRERQSRLQRAAEKRPDEFGYAVQTSFAAQDAKGLLPEDQGGLVDAQIQRLARDPGTDRARSHIDGRTKLHRLSVEGAPVSVEYEIDDQAQVVRVMRIEASPPGGAGDARVES